MTQSGVRIYLCQNGTNLRTFLLVRVIAMHLFIVEGYTIIRASPWFDSGILRMIYQRYYFKRQAVSFKLRIIGYGGLTNR